jgi:tRNA pseudouridine55 synthase
MNAGIHLLHKPVGPTSFSLVQACIGQTPAPQGKRRPRICHGGTLDPFASGLLLILVEPANRLFEYLHAIPKTYEATVRWGIETDNGDPLGKITFTDNISQVSESQLDAELQKFIGWQEQTPHPTSAKRIDGERAYLKAHRGETVNMPAQKVYLHEARWLSHDLPLESRLRISTRGGYYVRALARDLGRQLGCGAHLTQLHRSAIGPWNDPDSDKTIEVQGREILPWASVRELSDFEVGELRQKRDIPLGELLPPDWPVPAGFPDPQAPIRGFHLGKLSFLLRRLEEKLQAIGKEYYGL